MESSPFGSGKKKSKCVAIYISTGSLNSRKYSVGGAYVWKVLLFVGSGKKKSNCVAISSSTGSLNSRKYSVGGASEWKLSLY